MITAPEITKHIASHMPVLQPHERASKDAEAEAEAAAARDIARRLGIDVEAVSEDVFDEADSHVARLSKSAIIERCRDAGVDLVERDTTMVGCWSDIATYLAADGRI